MIAQLGVVQPKHSLQLRQHLLVAFLADGDLSEQTMQRSLHGAVRKEGLTRRCVHLSELVEHLRRQLVVNKQVKVTVRQDLSLKELDSDKVTNQFHRVRVHK